MSADLFKSLCAELLDELQALRLAVAYEVGCPSPEPPVVLRARAALAQPEPVAPPMPMPGDAEGLAEVFWGRYEQPEPEGPTDDELYELWEREGYEGDFQDCRRFYRGAIARWGTPAINPVPVSERLPEPEDCDEEGRCWWWHPAHIEDDFDNDWALLNHEWAGLALRDSDDSLIYTHWLPHWALPVPDIAAELEAQ